MNPCPTPPVCEFGEYGCEATTWWSEREFHVDGLSMVRCQWGDGGVYGMCGHRPYTADELSGTSNFRRGDRMGQRPEVDTVNVVPCDGTVTGDAILYGPIWIARVGIRDAGGDPENIGREGAEFVRGLQHSVVVPPVTVEEK